MKTSINVPDWLHQEVVQLNPDQAFGELVRDALLIALPEWRRNASKSSVERALRMQLRLEQARNARADAPAVPAVEAEKPAPRRRARPKTAPDARSNGHPVAGRQSQTRASVPASRRGSS